MQVRNIHCKTTPVARSKGHGMVSGAAYRAGVNLYEREHGVKIDGKLEEQGKQWHTFANKNISVREAYLLLPHNAPIWAHDRGELMNRIEERETAQNARLGREVQLGFAYELSNDEQRQVLDEFAMREFVDKGFAVDIAIHDYGKTIPAMNPTGADKQKLRDWFKADIPFLNQEQAKGREDPHILEVRNQQRDLIGYKLYQPHAHIRVVGRTFTGDKFTSNKNAARDFNKHETAMRWRYEWPEMQNRILQEKGIELRLRSVSDDEELYSEVDFLGTTKTQSNHHIEQRKEQLTPQQREKHEEINQTIEADIEFREILNDALKKHKVTEQTDQEEDYSGSERQQIRLAAWWQNMSNHYEAWGKHWNEEAEIWKKRLALQMGRLKQYFSSHHAQEPKSGSPQNKVVDIKHHTKGTSAEQNRSPPDVEPEL